MSTLALAAICKNEENHIERWLNCWLPLVDHVYLTDTGSTDKTIEIALRVGGDKITIRHFDWVDDFAAARNFGLGDIKEDYIGWSDLDDEVLNPEGFLKWRKKLDQAEIWLATYHYVKDVNGKPACSFIRERFFRNNPEFRFHYPVHEGLKVTRETKNAFTDEWAIQHLRTPEDLAKDKGRNLRIFERLKAKGEGLDARMRWYYGKELYEAGRVKEALPELLGASGREDLEQHDRVLCMQYACHALILLEHYQECVNHAQAGLMIDPKRAEFYVVIGDCYVKLGRVDNAIPSCAAARACINPGLEMGEPAFIFSYKDAYGPYPHKQLVRSYFHIGRLEDAERELQDLEKKHPDEEVRLLRQELDMIRNRANRIDNAPACDDIVFTCLGGLYEWDPEIEKTRGLGGSEIAACEMAAHLKKLTGRRVIVFNTPREKEFIDAAGVEYAPVAQMDGYFQNHKPALHIAWRHNERVTAARTLVWCHDLSVPGIRHLNNFDKILALSPFHKDVLVSQGVPVEKIHITRNGIRPELWKDFEHKPKNPNKIVFASSPDRGLEQACQVVELARLEFPDLELHAYYGTGNMRKMGAPEMADHYENLPKRYPFLRFHGNKSQRDLIKEYEDAAVWLYPTVFQESFCITALEMVASNVFPVVRDKGALNDTLFPYLGNNALVIDADPTKIEGLATFASALSRVISRRPWERMAISKDAISWESVAKEWVRDFLS